MLVEASRVALRASDEGNQLVEQVRVFEGVELCAGVAGCVHQRFLGGEVSPAVGIEAMEQGERHTYVAAALDCDLERIEGSDEFAMILIQWPDSHAEGTIPLEVRHTVSPCLPW
jgi:hypothetical protein